MLQDSEQEGGQRDNGPAGNQAAAEPGTARLFLCLHDESDDIAHFVAEFGNRVARGLDSLDEASGIIRDDPAANLLLVYANPVMCLARRVATGETIFSAIDRWREQTERLLAVFRSDRRRITLVDGHAALASPALFARLLAERVAVAPWEPGAEPEPRPETGELEHLIIAQALLQDESASSVITELQASSLPLDHAYRVDIESVAAAWMRGSAPLADAPEFLAARAENELLRLQLTEAHETVDTQRASLESLGQIRARAEKAELKRDTIEDEFRTARDAWKNERKLLADKLKRSADDLAAIRHSLSWRLTEPARRFIGLFKAGNRG